MCQAHTTRPPAATFEHAARWLAPRERRTGSAPRRSLRSRNGGPATSRPATSRAKPPRPLRQDRSDAAPLADDLRIERVAQAVADEVDAEHGRDDRQAGERDPPPVAL